MAMVDKQPMIRRMKEFFVYDPSLKVLGTVPVVARENGRVVMMTKDQAQYWIDNMVIGAVPIGEVSAASRDMMHQVSKGRVSRDDEKLAEPVPLTKETGQGPQGVRGRQRIDEDKAALRGAVRSGFSPTTDIVKRKDLEER